MLWILIVVYLWAGFTSFAALWLLEGVGLGLNPMLKEQDQFKKNLRESPKAAVLVFLFWPLIIPVWIFTWWRHIRRPK